MRGPSVSVSTSGAGLAMACQAATRSAPTAFCQMVFSRALRHGIAECHRGHAETQVLPVNGQAVLCVCTSAVCVPVMCVYQCCVQCRSIHRHL